VRIIPRGTFLLPLLVVTLAALLFGFLLADRRERLYELRRRQARALYELRRLEQKRLGLVDERERLLTEPSAIERVAREQYGMVAPGEVAAPLSSSHPKPPPASPVPVESDGWDWLFGRGEYPWRVPLLVFAVGMVVLGTAELVAYLRGTES
jgi:cell division protein FtsB